MHCTQQHRAIDGYLVNADHAGHSTQSHLESQVDELNSQVEIL